MSNASQFNDLQAEADQNRIKSLRTELATCFTLITVAESERKIGNHEHAQRTLVDAEKAYSTIQQFLADPKHSTHLSDEEQRELTEGMSELRKSWPARGSSANQAKNSSRPRL